ncbi:hypothetical protein [Maridesulfovibrio hydrothermalis]|uniref:Uncharacterized protein n=1 Tax=Maridesulfovibrio hydrothermalis AM13 = DSM 14728 TaxID=1121451 RepID=L0RE54_9BACT|nr:hypothetical protein [Maridesulfovibrio hydrothermalis]CCO24460.1 conserved exported protein of unknown function [Maridesulfovibrio hydrothermalis AM13 = DSM 14728]
MFLKNLNTYLIFTVLAVTLLVCSPARAFFPSDMELDEIMYQKYGTLTSYEAVLTFPSEPETSITIFRGHDHWQQTFTSSANSNSTVISKVVGQYFKPIAQCPAGSDMPVPVLQLWSPDDPVSDWMSIGISNATRSYGFYDDTPAFVFGARQGDDSSPQIWFNNENFAPLKIVLDEERMITFGTYSKFAGFMLPHTGTMTVGEEVLDFKIEWKGIRKKISPSVFSAAAIKKESGCVIASTPVYEFLKKCLKLNN